MSIDVGKVIGKPPPTLKESTPSPGRQEPANTKTQPETDVVRLTETASKLRLAERSLDSVPEVDANRVAVIARAIERGEYPINPERLAEKFVQLEQELAKQ
jgi:negative regulator of flagellin synthesis FlgM